MGFLGTIFSGAKSFFTGLNPNTLLSAGAGLVGNLISGNMQSHAQRDANRINLELAERQNEFNKQWWHEANEYNSPENQMLRYQAAGLNPNLIYGSAVNSPVSSGRSADMSVSPETGLAIGISRGFGSLASGIIQAQQIELQRKSTEADIKLKDSAAAKNYADAGITNANLDILNQTRDERIRRLGLENDEISSRIDLNKSVIDLNGAKYVMTNQQIANLKVNEQLLIQQTGINDWKAKHLALQFEELKATVFMKWLEANNYEEYLNLRNQGLRIENAKGSQEFQLLRGKMKELNFKNRQTAAYWNWFQANSDVIFENETAKLLNETRGNALYEELDHLIGAGAASSVLGKLISNSLPITSAIKPFL